MVYFLPDPARSRDLNFNPFSFPAMPDSSNLYAIARILNFAAPKPEAVQYARNVRVLSDGRVELEWTRAADADGLRPDEAAALLSGCEEREEKDYRSPGCVEPDEFHLLVLEDARRLASRPDLSPEILRDETRRLAFPPAERGPELLEAAGCMLSGRLPTGDHEPMEREEWDSLFRESGRPPAFDAGARIWIRSPDAVVARCSNGRYLCWDSRRGSIRFVESPYSVFRILAPLLRAAAPRA